MLNKHVNTHIINLVKIVPCVPPEVAVRTISCSTPTLIDSADL